MSTALKKILVRCAPVLAIVAVAFTVFTLRLPASRANAADVSPHFPAFSAAGAPVEHGKQVAVLAGGCFWGMEAVFEQLKGVKSVVAGYSGGAAATAHYEMVSTGMTGHAESVQIAYDPAVISYATLLQVYFSVAHDPTERDRQGPDDGSQYRSSIFFTDPAQKAIAEAYVHQLTASKTFSAPIVTTIVPLAAFYVAEDYHQKFAIRNPSYPYIVEIDEPKIQALHARFPRLVASAN